MLQSWPTLGRRELTKLHTTPVSHWLRAGCPAGQVGRETPGPERCLGEETQMLQVEAG